MTDKPFLDLIYGNLPPEARKSLRRGGFHATSRGAQLSREKLRRNPYCQAPGCREPAQHADHIWSAATYPHLALGINNLQSLGKRHRSQKTASADGALGNARKGGDYTFKPSTPCIR